MTVPGLHKHFKGNLYRVLFVAREATTDQRIVVYIPLYGDGNLTWRTEQEFEEWMDRDGYKGPRFYRIVELTTRFLGS